MTFKHRTLNHVYYLSICRAKWRKGTFKIAGFYKREDGYDAHLGRMLVIFNKYPTP